MNKVPMKLQFFAEPETEPNSGETGTDDGGKKDTETQKEPKPKYTDVDVDKIVQAKLAKEAKKREEAVKEAERQAKMSADQKKDYKLKKAEEERQKALDELNHLKLVKKVRSDLTNDGLNLTDDELELVVTNDEDTTNHNIEVIKSLHANIAEQVKNELLKGTPPKSPTIKSQSVTQEQFNQMSSRERTDLFKNNPEEFNRLTNIKRGEG
ncbi:DUF4355 domain-containing protein [Bombilactobacillus bombi]|nr:DUF4355 domain-containing protein [Bombilactobacillus bombi]